MMLGTYGMKAIKGLIQMHESVVADLLEELPVELLEVWGLDEARMAGASNREILYFWGRGVDLSDYAWALEQGIYFDHLRSALDAGCVAHEYILAMNEGLDHMEVCAIAQVGEKVGDYVWARSQGASHDECLVMNARQVPLYRLAKALEGGATFIEICEALEVDSHLQSYSKLRKKGLEHEAALSFAQLQAVSRS